MSIATDISQITQMMLREAKCEAKHGRGKVPAECSYEPTHRYSVGCLGVDKLVCQIVAEYVLGSITSGNKCAECRHPACDHWSVVPV